MAIIRCPPNVQLGNFLKCPTTIGGQGQGQGGFVVRGEGGAKFLSAREEKRGGRTEGRQGGTRSVARSIRGSP